MDILLICRDALENSLLGNIALALEAKKSGTDAGILFTQEALAALAGEPFRWSPLLENRDSRIKILRQATEMGIQIASEKDQRWTDIGRLIKSAKEAGIPLMACPLWSELLEVDGKLPSEISIIDSPTLLKEIEEAKAIIGGF